MAQKTNLSFGAVVVLLIAAYFGLDLQQESSEGRVVEQEHQKKEQHQTNILDQQSVETFDTSRSSEKNAVAQIAQAYQQKRSNVQVQANGVVKAVLTDDQEGSRHQKFILLLNNGLTVLVAHNIDLAPRIHDLKKGDTVEFFGEYEYSEQGGVMHWTHHDPQKQHVDGWLKHQGQIYQ